MDSNKIRVGLVGFGTVGAGQSAASGDYLALARDEFIHRFCEFSEVGHVANEDDDVVLVNADGGLGFPALRPYDRISITAACRDVPPPLLEQLSPWGRLIGPVVSGYETQELILVEKTEETIRKALICEVLYVSLQGRYGS